jgi:uncharacterized membrane protein YccC
MLQPLFEFRPTTRPWHFPILAGLSVGLPLLAGHWAGNLAGGKLASLAGLVILYTNYETGLLPRMLTLMACSFGILVSFVVGALCGAHPLLVAGGMGMFAAVLHVVIYYFKLYRPPGNFFFIMIASVAACLPFELASLPARVGYVALGTMLACGIGLVYSLLALRGHYPAPAAIALPKPRVVNLVEALTFGGFVGLSLLLAYWLHLDTPYWVPVSCMAVMQGASTVHVWQRGVQRVLGTLVGLGLAWAVLQLHPSLLTIGVAIVGLQIVVEVFIVRNYAVAVVFLTVLTIFLAESDATLLQDPNGLLQARGLDILLGSALGAVGGWVLYHERLHALAARQARRTRMVLSRQRKRTDVNLRA